MPLPSPRKDQDQNEFISMCAQNPTMQKEFPDQKKRLAVCYSQWKQAKKKKKSNADATINFEDQVGLGFIILHEGI